MSRAMRRPVPLACSTTAAALLFLVAGAGGFTLDRHAAFAAGTPWSGAVIWGQVSAGLVLLMLAGWLWLRAARWLQR